MAAYNDFDADIADYEFIDRDSNDFDDLVSHQHQQNYAILSEVDIHQRQKDNIMRISTVLSISKVEAGIPLCYYSWSTQEIHIDAEKVDSDRDSQ